MTVTHWHDPWPPEPPVEVLGRRLSDETRAAWVDYWATLPDWVAAIPMTLAGGLEFAFWALDRHLEDPDDEDWAELWRGYDEDYGITPGARAALGWLPDVISLDEERKDRR